MTTPIAKGPIKDQYIAFGYNNVGNLSSISDKSGSRCALTVNESGRILPEAKTDIALRRWKSLSKFSILHGRRSGDEPLAFVNVELH